MMTVSESGVGLTPELLHRKRNRGAVTGQAAATSASRVRERTLVLRQTGRVHDHTPVSAQRVSRSKSSSDGQRHQPSRWPMSPPVCCPLDLPRSVRTMRHTPPTMATRRPSPCCSACCPFYDQHVPTRWTPAPVSSCCCKSGQPARAGMTRRAQRSSSNPRTACSPSHLGQMTPHL